MEYTEMLNTLIKEMHSGLMETLSRKAILEDYEQCNPEMQASESTNLQKTIDEIRIGLFFVVMDLCVSDKALKNSISSLERSFHMKNECAIISEGFKFIYNYGNSRNKTFWHKLQNYSIINTNTNLKTEYDAISNSLSSFGDSIDKNLRDLTLHYDDDMVNVYDVTADILTSDFASQLFTKFFEIANQVVSFTTKVQDEIQKDLGEATETIKNTHHSNPVPILEVIAKNLLGNAQLLPILEQGIESTAKQLDSFKVESSRITTLEQLINGFPQIGKIDEIDHISQLLNIHLLLRFMIADFASLLRGFILSESEIERKLNVRRLIVTKTSTLVHLIGYTEAEKSKALWPYIKSLIPNEQPKLHEDANEIETMLLKLCHNEDKDKRALFVHLANNSNAKSNIAELMQELDKPVLAVSIIETHALITHFSKLQTFLTNLMAALAEDAHEKRVTSMKVIEEMADGIINNVAESKLPDDLKETLINRTKEVMSKILTDK